MKEEIRKLKGNLLLISNDEKLMNLIEKNKNITESYVLSTISSSKKGKLKFKNKKIQINKIRKYFKKKSIDNIIVDYNLIKKYISCFVKNSIYLNKGNLYFYNLDEDIDYKYKRYNVEIEKNKNFMKIDNTKSKNNFIKDNYYIFKDKKDKLLDILSDFITS